MIVKECQKHIALMKDNHCGNSHASLPFFILEIRLAGIILFGKWPLEERKLHGLFVYCSISHSNGNSILMMAVVAVEVVIVVAVMK